MEVAEVNTERETMYTDWHGCYDGNWRGIISNESFAHPAKFARGLVERIVTHGLKQGYWRAGDTIGDCFGGIASGGVICGYHGLNWIGVELEPRFVELGNANLAMHGPNWLTLGAGNRVVLLQGDSRRFADYMGVQLRGIVSSPPYAASDTKPTKLGTGKGTRAAKEFYDAVMRVSSGASWALSRTERLS